MMFIFGNPIQKVYLVPSHKPESKKKPRATKTNCEKCRMAFRLVLAGDDDADTIERIPKVQPNQKNII